MVFMLVLVESVTDQQMCPARHRLTIAWHVCNFIVLMVLCCAIVFSATGTSCCVRRRYAPCLHEIYQHVGCLVVCTYAMLANR